MWELANNVNGGLVFEYLQTILMKVFSNWMLASNINGGFEYFSICKQY